MSMLSTFPGFMSHDDVLVHAKDVHGETWPSDIDTRFQFRCSQCPKGYTSRIRLELHISRVHGTVTVLL